VKKRQDRTLPTKRSAMPFCRSDTDSGSWCASDRWPSTRSRRPPPRRRWCPDRTPGSPNRLRPHRRGTLRVAAGSPRSQCEACSVQADDGLQLQEPLNQPCGRDRSGAAVVVARLGRRQRPAATRSSPCPSSARCDPNVTSTLQIACAAHLSSGVSVFGGQRCARRARHSGQVARSGSPVWFQVDRQLPQNGNRRPSLGT
jgi:hypothetical protein